ncbi:MAG TPA: prolipoprotein diacylglyceryl transferase family protein [Kofleriaceae bacterium]
MRPLVVHWLAHYVRADVADVLAPTWFMCVGIAGLVGLILMLVLARRRGLESGTVASAVLWCYIAAVSAGIVIPMTIEAIEHGIATGHVEFRWAGMTSFWGYLAGGAALAAVCKRDGVPLARMGDLAAIPIGVALVFARIGCFMAGCDFGKVSALPWAVRFPAGSPAWRDHLHAGLIPAGNTASLPVHPTQLYEAFLGLVIVAVAWVVGRRARTEGRMFLAAAATYAIGRLLIETLRGDAGRGIYAGLSSGQIFSLVVLIAIAAKLAVTKRVMATAIAAAFALVTFAHVDKAGAQPAADSPPAADEPPPPPTDAQPAADAPPAPAGEPPAPPSEQLLDLPPPPVEAVRPLRPIFALGLLFGGATALNRPGEQVPDLSGVTLSFGFIPGRFGFWLDVDRLTNNDASHDTAIASVSFVPRVTPHLWIGARAGVGITRVNFVDPMFADVTAANFRIDAVAEYVMNHNWVLWLRPLTIDVVSAAELGGPITTLQFRAGVAYRFGDRGTGVAAPPPPPAPMPTFEAP